MRRLLIAINLHRDAVLAYSWARAWKRAGELA